MKYYLIAGEKSGDLHAAQLMKELKAVDQAAEFRFYGGDEMKKQGGHLVRHYRDMAFMGILEVLKNLLTIKKYIKECKNDLDNYKPDVVIHIDYADFNMRIAEFAKSKGYKTFYYISPKIWAWRTGRAKNIKANIDRMFTILPFETSFYANFDYPVDYVGNPSFDEIRDFKPCEDFLQKNGLSDAPILTLLPGSRKQELDYMLQTMVEASKEITSHQIVIGGVTSLPISYYQPYIDQGIHVIFDQSFDLLSHSDKALVTSGTASLETCLFNVPQIVCYKTSGLTTWVIKNFVKVKFASLVNLIAEKEIVKELILDFFTLDNLKVELSKLMSDSDYNDKINQNYTAVFEKLGKKGAPKNAALKMYEYLTK